MSIYDEDEDFDLDREDEDYETLEELNIDEDGHVVEGNRRKRRSREDEYEPDYEDIHPEAYGYDNSRDDD